MEVIEQAERLAEVQTYGAERSSAAALGHEDAVEVVRKCSSGRSSGVFSGSGRPPHFCFSHLRNLLPGFLKFPPLVGKFLPLTVEGALCRRLPRSPRLQQSFAQCASNKHTDQQGCR
jgi:hypothetical protein